MRYLLSAIFSTSILLIITADTKAQKVLKPGFNAQEYLQMLDIFEDQNSDTSKPKKIFPSLNQCEHIYQSPEVGLVNRFDIWKRSDNVGIICIRGTVAKPDSWMENFYAGMVPAIGSLQLNDSTTFDYKLATDSNARVHVGWTIGLGFIMPLMTKQINELYAKGVSEFIIIGHSQGGALAFLVRSYLQYCKEVPKNIFYKTYASAAPKPGNLYYAYDFEFITRDGWGLRVVNTEDWVPETPFSIQTLSDINPVNPLTDIEKIVGKQKWYVRWYLNSVVRKLNRSTNRAMKRYQKYLGTKISSLIRKSLTQYQKPVYANSMIYMTAGTPVILKPNDLYKNKFIYNGKNIFVHHTLSSYRFLINTIYP